MKFKKLPIFLLLSIVLVNLHNVLCLRSQKSVNVVLDAKWPTTPLHLEVSEFFSEESSNLFWKFVDDVFKLGPNFLQDRTPKQQYDIVTEIASRYLSPARLALLKFSLALRAYSPTIEMFNQVADSKEFPENCESVVEIGNEFACSLEEFEKLLSSSENRESSSVFKVDHNYPSFSGKDLPIVVLYSEIGSSTFHQFHTVLLEKAQNTEINYIIRHYVAKRSKRKARLSGYGVELAIKSTEYKAQDDTEVKEDSARHQEEIDKQEEIEGFLFHRLRELHPDKKDQLEKFKTFVLDSTKEMETLRVWELQELSLQAVKRILGAPKEETLRVMQDISQNFPIMAKSLVHITVPSELKREIDKNQQMFAQYHNIGPSDAAIFLNGLYFDAEVTDIFTLLQTLKQETRVLEGLHGIGIEEKKISKLLHLDLSEDKQDFAVDIRDTAVQYINDIENDKMYRNWPSSVQDMLRVTYPGMLKNVRKNIYHLIIVADPKETETRDLFKLAESFYIHKAPVRIGLVLAVNPNTSVSGNEDAGVALLIAYNFISQKKTTYDGLSFITDVYATLGDKELTSEEVIKTFKSKYAHEEYDAIFSSESDYDFGRKLAWEFINRTGMGVPPQVLINGIILKKNQLNVDMFEEAVLTEIMKQTSFIQKSVYKGDLTDSHNVLDFLMSQKTVMPRLNKKILTPGSKYIDLTGNVVENVSSEEFPHLSVLNMAATFESKLTYLRRKPTNFFHPITLWVVADLETENGREIVYNAVQFLKSSKDIRLGIIHNPASIELKSGSITVAVQAIVDKLETQDATQLLFKILKPTNADLIINGAKKVTDFLSTESEVDANDLEQFISSYATDFLTYHSVFCKNVLNLAPSERGVIANGRVIAPLSANEAFGEDDFNLLEKYSLSVFGDKLSKILGDNSDEAESQLQSTRLILQTTGVLMSNQQTKNRHDIKFHSDKHSVVTLPASDPKEPAHEILVIVDPVSRGGQKMSTLLLVLQQVVNANVKIFFNCVDKHSDMPLKSFYRFVLEAEPQFGKDEDLGPGPFARFSNMPTTPLLTLGMGVPENWMVECVRTHHDLDNIHLEKVESGIYAEFELEHLLLEGHCFEQSTGNPPRGLQFTLGTPKQPVKVDTIVMANLGYFQLKASPGVWFLRLRQGRSAEIYDVAGHENTDSPPGSPEVVVAITNFRSHVIKIRVNKKPGKQNEELLYDGSEAAGSGIWDSITSTFTTSGEKDKEEVDDKINIFSLASGHLYERLLRIMMLSVLKNTKTPVKFWFLKNYLSPTFKDFLPIMAEQYGFEYELVQYKWPRWLNQQTEKQRIIWGYKILFLDVLFPLDVKKFIFVDADQVVRADMKDLRDLDLGGAPYGYTPFCESRTDMDGYRFWKSGYWASHLAHRKYHISALYVVDLKKFRRIAAGDRLRGQYQGLSQDPNSLSNLDQDLPNNMIHQVNIKSLPQEWLWCETWCDDASKKSAKTIDLCNNPKTKESKLQAAMRIIPEWKGYDDEIKNLFEKYEKGKIEETENVPEKSQDDSKKHQEL